MRSALTRLTLGALLGLAAVDVGAAPAPGTTLERTTAEEAKDLLPPEILRHYQNGDYRNAVVEFPNSRWRWTTASRRRPAGTPSISCSTSTRPPSTRRLANGPTTSRACRSRTSGRTIRTPGTRCCGTSTTPTTPAATAGTSCCSPGGGARATTA